jgi:hypothetical protein
MTTHRTIEDLTVPELNDEIKRCDAEVDYMTIKILRLARERKLLTDELKVRELQAEMEGI